VCTQSPSIDTILRNPKAPGSALHVTSTTCSSGACECPGMLSGLLRPPAGPQLGAWKKQGTRQTRAGEEGEAAPECVRCFARASLLRRFRPCKMKHADKAESRSPNVLVSGQHSMQMGTELWHLLSFTFVGHTSAKGLHFHFGREFQLPSVESTKEQVSPLLSPPLYLTDLNNSRNSYKKSQKAKAI